MLCTQNETYIHNQGFNGETWATVLRQHYSDNESQFLLADFVLKSLLEFGNHFLLITDQRLTLVLRECRPCNLILHIYEEKQSAAKNREYSLQVFVPPDHQLQFCR